MFAHSPSTCYSHLVSIDAKVRASIESILKVDRDEQSKVVERSKWWSQEVTKAQLVRFVGRLFAKEDETTTSMPHSPKTWDQRIRQWFGWSTDTSATGSDLSPVVQTATMSNESIERLASDRRGIFEASTETTGRTDESPQQIGYGEWPSYSSSPSSSQSIARKRIVPANTTGCVPVGSPIVTGPHQPRIGADSTTHRRTVGRGRNHDRTVERIAHDNRAVRATGWRQSCHRLVGGRQRVVSVTCFRLKSSQIFINLIVKQTQCC